MTDTVKEVIDRNIRNMFTDLVDEYNLRSGDFAPEQEFALDKIKEDLGELLCDYVHQNLEGGTMTVQDLIDELSKIKDKSLDVAIETTKENLWVQGLKVNNTGDSGYEDFGCVELEVSE